MVGSAGSVAALGLHSRETRQVKVGKHGVAVQPRIPWARIVICALLVIAVCIVPFAIALNKNDPDTQAYGDFERTAFTLLNDMSGQADKKSLPTDRVSYASNVTERMQNSIMSGGCELVSLSIVFTSMGIDANLHDFVDNYLDIDGHFATGYSGNPYSEGAGFPPGITTAANRYLASIDADVRAHNLTGSSFSDLRKLVDLGYPVMFWTTMGFEDPDFTGVYDNEREWYSNEHCVVVYGFDRGNALVSDPLEGFVVRDASRFAEIYEKCGSMALAIY